MFISIIVGYPGVLYIDCYNRSEPLQCSFFSFLIKTENSVEITIKLIKVTRENERTNE